MTLTLHTYTDAIAACARPLAGPEEEAEVLQHMRLNPPNVAAAVRYPPPPVESARFASLAPLPPSPTQPPRGAPAGATVASTAPTGTGAMSTTGSLAVAVASAGAEAVLPLLSVAPQFASYGTPGTRGAYAPAVELAFYLFEEARSAGLAPDRVAYTALMGACGAHRQVERALSVFELFRQHGASGVLVPNNPASKQQQQQQLQQQQQESQNQDASSHVATTAANACASVSSEITATNDVHSASVIGIADRSAAHSATSVLTHGVDRGYQPNARTVALSEAAAGDRVRGMEVDRIVVMKLMQSCWKAHQYELAEDLMHDMWMEEGVQPDAPMYNLMIRIAAETAQVRHTFTTKQKQNKRNMISTVFIVHFR